jgi:hypothetical protein
MIDEEEGNHMTSTTTTTAYHIMAISTHPAPGTPTSRVYVGPFTSRPAAEYALAVLGARTDIIAAEIKDGAA